MTRSELDALLRQIRGVHVAVLGDFCLDLYWFIDPTLGERSIETGKPTLPVRSWRQAPGGAGNVAANLAAMECASVAALGVVGSDPWGRELDRLLRLSGVDTTGLIEQAEGWDTPAYVKPHVGDEEQSRIDFGGFNRLADCAADRLLDRLESVLPGVGSVVINQQLLEGVHAERLRLQLASLMRRHTGTPFVVDSRHHSGDYPGACLKINEHEAAQRIGLSRPRGRPVPRADVLRAADALFAEHGRPVFITRSWRGTLVRDEAGVHEVPGVRLGGPIDPVGAGDAVVAGVALALAAGRTPAQAAMLGNLAAAVTVRKLKQTGTATPDEIRAAADMPVYSESEIREDSDHA